MVYSSAYILLRIDIKLPVIYTATTREPLLELFLRSPSYSYNNIIKAFISWLQKFIIQHMKLIISIILNNFLNNILAFEGDNMIQ